MVKFWNWKVYHLTFQLFSLLKTILLFIARFLLYMYWPGPGMLRHCIPICWTFGPVQIWRQNNETHPETNLLCSSGCVSSCKDSCISLFTRVAARACLLFVFCRCETPCFGYVFVCCVCVCLFVCVLWNAENMHGSLHVVFMLCFFGVWRFFLKAEQTINWI